GVVIGAGHNGLTLAAYLARAGMRIAVPERNGRIGGGSSTDEPTLPRYKHNMHANFYMGIGLYPLPQDLELHRYGSTSIEPLVRKHFVDERIRTLFTSYMHVITTENVPGAGIVFPAIFANIASFTLPVGGAVSLPLALARVVEAGGGEIVTGADVKEIIVKSG